MLCVVLVEHCRRDIRYVSPCITLTSDINLEFRDPKDRLEVREEIYEILGNVFFARGCDIANCKASADRLFHPQDICQVDPTIWVECRVVLAPAPYEPTIFLEKSLEGTAPRSTVKPDCDFINWRPVGRLEDKK